MRHMQPYAVPSERLAAGAQDNLSNTLRYDQQALNDSMLKYRDANKHGHTGSLKMQTLNDSISSTELEQECLKKKFNELKEKIHSQSSGFIFNQNSQSPDQASNQIMMK